MAGRQDTWSIAFPFSFDSNVLEQHKFYIAWSKNSMNTQGRFKSGFTSLGLNACYNIPLFLCLQGVNYLSTN